MSSAPAAEQILAGVPARRGHFLYESGLHGDLWLNLETLCERPAELQPSIRQLAARVAPYKPDVICGPLIEGALIGLLVAAELRCAFTYALRFAPEWHEQLFSVEYQLPQPQHALVRGKRVAIINDVISAGSAVKGAYNNLQTFEADVVCVGSLMVRGKMFPDWAAEQDLPVEALTEMPSNLWVPSECPLCASGIPLESLATH